MHKVTCSRFFFGDSGLRQVFSHQVHGLLGLDYADAVAVATLAATLVAQPSHSEGRVPPREPGCLQILPNRPWIEKSEDFLASVIGSVGSLSVWNSVLFSGYMGGAQIQRGKAADLPRRTQTLSSFFESTECRNSGTDNL